MRLQQQIWKTFLENVKLVYKNVERDMFCLLYFKNLAKFLVFGINTYLRSINKSECIKNV